MEHTLAVDAGFGCIQQDITAFIPLVVELLVSESALDRIHQYCCPSGRCYGPLYLIALFEMKACSQYLA